MGVEFVHDPLTGKGTFYTSLKGAMVDRTSVVNTNIISWDSQSRMISCEFPNCAGTMNLGELTFQPGEHDAFREMMKNHSHFRTGG